MSNGRLEAFGDGVIAIIISALPASVIAVLYPTIQPAGGLLTGVWLWRAAEEMR